MIKKIIKPKKHHKPTVLMILDGWGHREEKENNAVIEAKTPFLDSCANDYPWCLLTCSGEEVGLPESYMGNSEVGHLNIGAGRVVYQDFTRINKAIKDGSFFNNKVLKEVFDSSLRKNKRIHIIGLLSDGGVHSHIDHFKAVLEYAKRVSFSNIIVHPIFDGRDTAPMEADRHLKKLISYFKEYKLGSIGSISGRYYAMDRDNRWDRVERAYNVLTNCEPCLEIEAEAYIKESHKKNIGDEFIEPVCVNKDSIIKDQDSIIFLNFRSDRARQITRAFIEKDFNEFNRTKVVNLDIYATLTQYDETFKVPVLFSNQPLNKILGEVISNNDLHQLRIAETEKYAHVTFFFNGGEEKKFRKETRILIDSPREVKTYDLKPEMSANEVTNALLENIDKDLYDFIVVNYANCDMVGHTGIFEAAVKAVETVDKQAQRVVEKVLSQDGLVFITADHGNAELMLSSDGVKHTAHTTNPVKFIIVSKDLYKQKIDFIKQEKKLADIAPTILDFMGIEKPAEMTGNSIVNFFIFKS